MTECLGSVAILLLLALVFETGLVDEGLWATADGTTLFLAQTAMTIVLLATVPGALYLFRLRIVRDRLIADGETALRRWLTRDKKAEGDQVTLALAEKAGQGRLVTVPLASLWEDTP